LKELLEDEEFTAGFDALLDIPGLWDGMRLTTLQKMMAMGCKDVSKHSPSTARTNPYTTGMFKLSSAYQGGVYRPGGEGWFGENRYSDREGPGAEGAGRIDK
jgi:hypothetical protein